MKRKIFTKVMKSILILLVVLGIGKVGWGQTIIFYSLDVDNAATEGIAANYPGQGRVLNLSGITSSGYDVTNGSTCYGWNALGSDAWSTSSFSTAGYWHITGSAQMKAVGTGPRDFKVQYSLNGTTWTDAPMTFSGGSITNITLTIDLQTFSFSLPTTCDNQAIVFVRWVQNSSTNVNGAALGASSSTKTASITSISIAGDAFASPTTQASSIKFISITPTTIKINCTNGNGNNRIIKINNTNTFTDPTNDSYPTANATYGGSGEQVIYNGTASSLTVTVPSSTNVYWFRVYEFNKLDNLTRYNISTATANPKQCKLETIHTPTSANIRLILANLGATISTPSTGTISARGIYWSTTSPVTETSAKVSQVSSASGVFVVSDIEVDRGTTIYYKGFVTNESGTILSSEASFTNFPIFTGTGNWETAARWNVQQVPGETGDVPYVAGDGTFDNPTINGTCTLTSDNGVNDLTINSGKILNINPAINLTVNGVLTNNGGTAGLKLLSSVSGTGSLMHNTDNVNATVQCYISGTKDLTARKYHLVSVPITAATYLSNVWLDSYLFTYTELDNTWFVWDSPTTNILQTKEGAMVFYPNWGATTYKIYNITGQLNNGAYSPTVAYSGSGKGYNLVPNPYPSAINWNAASGWTKTGIGSTIWGFSPTAGNWGSWNGSLGTNSVTNIVPVGQAFFVGATGNSPILTMTNSVRLHDTQLFLKSGTIIPNALHLIASGNEGQDEIAVQFADDATALASDKYDAIKFYGSMSVPQLSSYTIGDASLLSISGLPAGESSTIVPLHFEMDYSGELTFTAKGMESFNETSIQLEDKQLAQMIDLNINPVYTFNHTPTDALDRFVLHFSSIQTGIAKPGAASLSKVTTSGNEIYLQYPSSSNSNVIATVYDLQGRVINQIKLSGKGNDHISIRTFGAYLVKLNLSSGVETHKIVVL